MKYLVLTLALCVGLAFVFAGCQKAAETDTTGVAAPKGSPKPASTPAVPDKTTAAKTKTLTDPNGEKLVLKPATDTAFLKGIGVPEYPGATAYMIDMAETAKVTGESAGTESQLAMAEKLMKQVVFETSDDLAKVQTWAKENLKDWTVKEIEEKNGTKGFEASKGDTASLIAFDYTTDGKRYIMIMDMGAAMDELTKALEGADLGKAMPADAPKSDDKAPAKDAKDAKDAKKTN